MSDPINPFGGPFAGAPGIGGNPLDSEEHPFPKCPTCKSQNYHAWTMQYGLMRRCNDCGEEWSGGTVAAARPNFLEPPPMPGIPAPEELPVVQYTGAEFRNPDKNFGGDDDY